MEVDGTVTILSITFLYELFHFHVSESECPCFRYNCKGTGSWCTSHHGATTKVTFPLICCSISESFAV